MRATVTLAAICLLAAASAQAAAISSPVGTYLAFPSTNLTGPGPIALDGDISWSATTSAMNGPAEFGYTGGFGFSGNGFSAAGVAVASVNDGFRDSGVVDSMTFTFAKPVEAVGAVLNWDPASAPLVTIAVYDASNTLLDSLTLAAGGFNTATFDAFHGFQETTADISRFVLTDGYVTAIGGLTVQSPAPEPAAWALLALGFGALGLGLRGRRAPAVAG